MCEAFLGLWLDQRLLTDANCGPPAAGLGNHRRTPPPARRDVRRLPAAVDCSAAGLLLLLCFSCFLLAAGCRLSRWTAAGCRCFSCKPSTCQIAVACEIPHCNSDEVGSTDKFRRGWQSGEIPSTLVERQDTIVEHEIMTQLSWSFGRGSRCVFICAFIGLWNSQRRPCQSSCRAPHGRRKCLCQRRFQAQERLDQKLERLNKRRGRRLCWIKEEEKEDLVCRGRASSCCALQRKKQIDWRSRRPDLFFLGMETGSAG